MNNKEIRWKQRFQNFEKSFLLLKKYTNIKKPNEIERAGIIQFFEMCFELSWKLMKDYLESQGFTPDSPRESIKQAFQSQLISEGHTWLDALSDRNTTTHTYDEEKSLEITSKIINNYFPIINELYLIMRDKNK